MTGAAATAGIVFTHIQKRYILNTTRIPKKTLQIGIPGRNSIHIALHFLPCKNGEGTGKYNQYPIFI